MRCMRCRYAPPPDSEGFQDECPFFEEYGRKWKDGSIGCTLNYQTLRKWNAQRDESVADMGTDMGIAMDFENRQWDMERALSDLRHMIGLDGFKHKPYTRHGRKFYKPYRNYWAGTNKYLDYFSGALGIVEKQEPKITDGMPYYYLTKYGLHWLGRMIGVTIHPERD